MKAPALIARRTRRLLLAAGIVGLAVLTLAAAPVAVAAPSINLNTDRHVVEAGTDVYIAPGQTVDSVTVFGGNAVIAGTVRHAVVAVGGDVTVRDGAHVGTQRPRRGTAVVAVGGTTTIAPGADVKGRVRTFRDVTAGEALIAGAVAVLGVGVTVLAVTAAAAFGLLVAAGIIAGIVALIVWLVRRERRSGPEAGTVPPPPPIEPPTIGPEYSPPQPGATA